MMDREPTFAEVWEAFAAPFRAVWRAVVAGLMAGAYRLMLVAPWVPKVVHEWTLMESMQALNERIRAFAERDATRPQGDTEQAASGEDDV